MTNHLPDKIKDVYQFAPLNAYTRRERFSIIAADLVFYTLISLIGRTVRFEVEGWKNLEKLEQKNIPPVFVFWHNRIFLNTYYFRNRGSVVITSQSFDGEYIARFIKRFGYGAIRGSSTRGGVKALVEMIRLMREGLEMVFTADGPKGPKYVVKPGAVLLAKKTGNPILCVSVEAERFREIKTWDNLQIPKLFTRAKLFISRPIYVPQDADDATIEKKRLEIQCQLDELVALGKQWRDTLEN